MDADPQAPALPEPDRAIDGITRADGIASTLGTDDAAIDARDEFVERFQDPPPLLIVISGPSGVGKDEALKAMKSIGFPFHFVVTATTRPRRTTEVDGADYHFINVAAFAEMIDQGELLEYALVYGDYKGIPKQQVRAALASGQDVVLRIDVQGARTIRKLVPDAILIFMVAESVAELERRLRERKSEPADLLKIRIATAREEMRLAVDFDYVVVNRRDQLNVTVDTITAIIRAEKHRVARVARGAPIVL
ncbi:MAG: guanylate kinase [Ardenticatenales bacterium]|nr:guanylate kinase [Ardenticatenales bacterium]